MEKLRIAFSALVEIIKKPSLLNLLLHENDYQKKIFLKKHPTKASLPQISLWDIDPEYISEIDTFLLDGSSLPTDLALLRTLSKNKKSYFEIGTWRGESVWNVAKMIDDCTTFNLSIIEMKKMGLPIKYADLHGFLSKKIPRILHLEGNTLHFDFKKLNKKYDLIFIDGDHSYEMVKNDTQLVFDHLVHENSVVVWHDYAYNPEKIRYNVYRGILDGLPMELHKNLYHVANSMCAVFLKSSFETKNFESPKTPETLFNIKLTRV